MTGCLRLCFVSLLLWLYMSSESIQEHSPSTGTLQLLWQSKLGRFIKFGLVGGSGVVVNLVVFQVSFFLLQGSIGSADVRHTVANLCGIVVSIFTNFLLNDGWTWGDRIKGARSDWFKRLARYYATCSIAALCQLGVASLLFSLVFKDLPAFAILGVNIMPQIPLLIGIICGMAINFPLSHFWAFRNARSQAHDEQEP